MQSYHPFRQSILSRDELTRLNLLDPSIPIRDTLAHWATLLIVLFVVTWLPHPVTLAVAVVVIGIQIYGLLIIGHDGLHRRLFASTALNDLWNDLFILGPVGAITRINRDNHMLHHRDTCEKTDPDRHRYVHDHKEPVIPFLAFVSGLSNALPTIRNIFLGNAAARKETARKKYNLRDIAILVGWQAALVIGLTTAFGWWAYPTLWLLPLYTFGYRGDLLRVFCEHSMLEPDAAADFEMRLISFKSNWLERQFFAPHNMNYHMPHHLWPSIPYYNLPEADRLIREVHTAKPDPRLHWRRSYIGHMIKYFRWRLTSEGQLASTESGRHGN